MKNLFKLLLLAAVAVAGAACDKEEAAKSTTESYWVYFSVVDAQTGEDLLDPATEGNFLDQEIKLTHNGELYQRPKVADLEPILQASPSEPFALRWGKRSLGSGSADERYWLAFGPFLPSEHYYREVLTIDWGDGTQNEVVLDCYFQNDKTDLRRALWVDGKAQGEDWRVVHPGRARVAWEQPKDISDYHWEIISRHTEVLQLGDQWAANTEEVGALMKNLIAHTENYDPAQVEAMLSATHWEEAVYATSTISNGQEGDWSSYGVAISTNWHAEDYICSYHSFNPDGDYEGYFLPSDFGYWEALGVPSEGQLPLEIVENSVLTWSFDPNNRTLTIHQLYEGQSAEEHWTVRGIASDILIISAPSTSDPTQTRYYLYLPPEPEK